MISSVAKRSFIGDRFLLLFFIIVPEVLTHRNIFIRKENKVVAEMAGPLGALVLARTQTQTQFPASTWWLKTL